MSTPVENEIPSIEGTAVVAWQLKTAVYHARNMFEAENVEAEYHALHLACRRADALTQRLFRLQEEGWEYGQE